MIIVFADENERFIARALDGTKELWQEELQRESVGIWLKQASDAGKIQRQDALFLVIAESELVRRIVTLPLAVKPRQQRAMAESALAAVLGERPAALRLQRLDEEGHFALAGCRKDKLTQASAPFAGFAKRLQFLGAADYQLAQQGKIPDGCYQLQTPFWSAVIVAREGHVIDARTGNGGNIFALEQELRREHQKLGLAELPQAQLLLAKEQANLDVTKLLNSVLTPVAADFGISLREDRKVHVLCVFCVLLPLLVLTALALRPQTVAEQPEQVQTVENVQRSEYSTLLTQAYAVKSERITLLAQEATDDALALSGRTSEVLDLAAYMRSLAEVSPNLHPLLLELTRTSEEEKTYYEFTIQISLAEEVAA